MKIYNYIKDSVCEPIAADSRKQADSMFISGFDIRVDEVQNDNYTQLHYKTLLRKLKDKLNSLEFLNEYNHGEQKSDQH